MKDNSSTNVRHRPWVNMSTGLCPAGRAGVPRAELGGTRVVPSHLNLPAVSSMGLHRVGHD